MRILRAALLFLLLRDFEPRIPPIMLYLANNHGQILQASKNLAANVTWICTGDNILLPLRRGLPRD